MMQLVIHFVVREEWPGVRMHKDSWVVVNSLVDWSGTYKEKDGKTGDEGVWGRGMWRVDQAVSMH